ncbi:MAG TPA: NADH-quinone oxidoreductase subunit A [Chryseolinea sp.]|nr:NADH-quinone oxidoreductase subunit A [Chryseolinea sp.]
MLIFGPVQQDQYISAFGEVLLFIIAGSLFVIVTMVLSSVIRPSRPNSQKLATYESGEETVGTAWVQFNIRFYIVALIFLLFEVEIVFLFPWSTVYANKDLISAHPSWGWISMAEMVMFILILAVGLAYAWRNGFLDWEKPHPTPTKYQSKVPKELYVQINKKYETSINSKK